MKITHANGLTTDLGPCAATPGGTVSGGAHADDTSRRPARRASSARAASTLSTNRFTSYADPTGDTASRNVDLARRNARGVIRLVNVNGQIVEAGAELVATQTVSV